jgi:hypothetical protein
MSRHTKLSATALLACAFAAMPLAAQQDTGMMMQHDSAMMDHGQMDNSMKHDEQMMGKDSAMGGGANLMFMGAAGQRAAGDYEITEAEGKQQLKLTDDFAVAAGPDLYLVLANGDTPDKKSLYLGKLKQATGGQAYDLPKGKDLGTYTTLLVWSKKDKRAVASAEWHPTSGGMMEHR